MLRVPTVELAGDALSEALVRLAAAAMRRPREVPCVAGPVVDVTMRSGAARDGRLKTNFVFKSQGLVAGAFWRRSDRDQELAQAEPQEARRSKTCDLRLQVLIAGRSIDGNVDVHPRPLPTSAIGWLRGGMAGLQRWISPTAVRGSLGKPLTQR